MSLFKGKFEQGGMSAWRFAYERMLGSISNMMPQVGRLN